MSKRGFWLATAILLVIAGLAAVTGVYPSWNWPTTIIIVLVGLAFVIVVIFGDDPAVNQGAWRLASVVCLSCCFILPEFVILSPGNAILVIENSTHQKIVPARSELSWCFTLGTQCQVYKDITACDSATSIQLKTQLKEECAVEISTTYTEPGAYETAVRDFFSQCLAEARNQAGPSALPEQIFCVLSTNLRGMAQKNPAAQASHIHLSLPTA